MLTPPTSTKINNSFVWAAWKFPGSCPRLQKRQRNRQVRQLHPKMRQIVKANSRAWRLHCVWTCTVCLHILKGEKPLPLSKCDKPQIICWKLAQKDSEHAMINLPVLSRKQVEGEILNSSIRFDISSRNTLGIWLSRRFCQKGKSGISPSHPLRKSSAVANCIALDIKFAYTVD